MRKQYHLRNSDDGLLAWDVDRLIKLTAGMPIHDIALSTIRELDEPYWFGDDSAQPTCRAIADHAKLMHEADLSYPIILDPDGRVMDGMHRAAKAYLLGHATIQAVQLKQLPPPDFTGVPEHELPYDEA